MSASNPTTTTTTTSSCTLKKKRRPAGTPDPDAEVVSLPPQTLLESDRYVCEICNQGFQRDQNLQMHRRHHKVPWKLLKRDPAAVLAGGGEEAKKRVFVCPEVSCLHHDPRHALGDLVGIKKHYRRKHSDRRQWVCQRCSKGYAVQSDYKAHLKTCGTRGHTCDCGKVFSRVESFIEHQDSCYANRSHQNTQSSNTPQTHYSLSPTASSPTPSTLTTNFTSPPPPPPPPSSSPQLPPAFRPTFELQLLPPSSPPQPTTLNYNEPCSDIPQCLNLSLGLSSWVDDKDQAKAQMVKREVELAEEEFAKAKKIRQQAQKELESALILGDHAAKSINSILLQLTCQSCKVKMWPSTDKDPN